jgi:hypothetical protein
MLTGSPYPGRIGESSPIGQVEWRRNGASCHGLRDGLRSAGHAIVAMSRRQATARRRRRTFARVSRVTPLIATVLLLLAPEGAVASGPWTWPVEEGSIAGGFTFDRSAPFAGGARRGIDVAAAAGARVRSVCGGRVSYAGRVPRWGRGVSLTCADGVVATELGLSSVRVARGVRVVPGATLGRLAARGILRVGARRAGERFGYVDPAALFAREDAPPRVAPSPVPSEARRRVAPRRVVARPVDAPAPSLPPLPVLLGAALLLAASTTGAAARRRRRGRPAAEIVLLQR